MSELLLKDPEVFPSSELLEKVLDNNYAVFKELMSRLETVELNPNWRFYKDGKAWFCKITRKEKTVVWLSLWSDCLKLGFYFTEKSGEGISGLGIDDSIKEFYLNHKPIGKLKPIVIELREISQLPDIDTLIKYKIGQL